jgi:benzoyl-CoA reductase/2-hydroxyglutaryl-CoA dehydratase subunit BcrC/BadD/HgdB
MAPDVYAEALSACVAELSDEPSAPSRATPPRLLLLPSEPLSHLHLHHAVEAAGATVVAEDDWWGARAPGDDLDIRSAGSAREALLQKYWLDTAGAGVWPAEAREAWFRAQALRPEIDGVVFYLPPSDHQLGWDYPRLKAWLDERGKPSLLLRDDAAAVNGRAAITARVADWLGR